MSYGRVIGRERHYRHCGHIEEYWEKPDAKGDLRFNSFTDCSPDCDGWGGLK